MASNTDGTTTSNPVDNDSADQENASEMENIDLDALAEEILSLFKRELQIERERLGWY